LDGLGSFGSLDFFAIDCATEYTADVKVGLYVA
jgi:hypothetical protein